MGSWILLGVLLGLTLASVSILCWQLVQVLLDVRQILGLVKDLTRDLKPALADVNDILHKSNLAMDEAGQTYQVLGENAREALSTLGQLRRRVRQGLDIAGTGLSTGVSYFRRGLQAENAEAAADTEQL